MNHKAFLAAAAAAILTLAASAPAAAGLFSFPCVYQELDVKKLSGDLEYELTFSYMTGDNENDLRMAEIRVGLAMPRKAGQAEIDSGEIFLLMRDKVHSPGRWSLARVRFRLDGKEASEGGLPGINDLSKAKNVILFLGAPRSKGDGPSVRYDNIEIEAVE